MLALVLVGLVHAEACRILVRQLQLGLVPAALAALRQQRLRAVLVEALAQVLTQVLGVPELLLLSSLVVDFA